MSNSFAYNIIPPSGSALIAQATAANPIVFVESLSCTLAAESDEDLASKNASWYTGKTGQIQAVSATDNRAHIVCRYTNAGSEQVAKSIAITARLASQSDSDAVILCAKSDPDSDARLPGSEQIGQFVEFGFTIDINGSSTVTATPGASATIADLDRFVSMHSAGNPNAGDAQSIRGTKDFLNDVYFEGTVYGDGSKLLVANSIYPDESVNYSLGTQSLVWDEVWGATGYFGGVYVDSIYKNSTDISAISVLSDLSMYANIVPGTTNTYALGDSTHAFSVIYTQNINTEVLGTAQASGVIGLVSDIAPYSGADVKIGTSSAPIPEGNFTTMKANNTMTQNLSSPATSINLRNPLIPYDNTASLGLATDGFYDLYLADQPGGGNVYNSPCPFDDDGSIELRIGSIVLVWVARGTAGSTKTINAGDRLKVGENDIGAICVAKSQATGSLSLTVTFGLGDSLSGYTFAALNAAEIPANELFTVILAVCIGY